MYKVLVFSFCPQCSVDIMITFYHVLSWASILSVTLVPDFTLETQTFSLWGNIWIISLIILPSLSFLLIMYFLRTRLIMSHMHIHPAYHFLSHSVHCPLCLTCPSPSHMLISCLFSVSHLWDCPHSLISCVQFPVADPKTYFWAHSLFYHQCSLQMNASKL